MVVVFQSKLFMQPTLPRTEYLRWTIPKSGAQNSQKIESSLMALSLTAGKQSSHEANNFPPMHLPHGAFQSSYTSNFD